MLRFTDMCPVLRWLFAAHIQYSTLKMAGYCLPRLLDAVNLGELIACIHG